MNKTAQKVIEQEIAGLKALENVLDDNFTKMVDKIFDVTHHGKGRVILSGMGKSGHVARKIGATMASTGTPSFFVHPAEASHGDMGMITQHDVVILLSNSGETAELKDIIAYCKRFGIYLIGWARRATSALIDASDIAIILPETPEANSINAPTTSTTMMMALGDALAVCLLEKTGFVAEDFKNLHPGGKLGAQFMQIADIMHKGDETPLVDENETMATALVKITSKKFGCAAVINNKQELIGIITDGDIRRHMDTDFLNKKTTEIMTRNPITVRPKALAAEALHIMEEKRITSLFIAENNKPVGIIHIHDLLHAGVS